MKSGIHPEYNDIEVTCSCGEKFTTKSTMNKALNVEVHARSLFLQGLLFLQTLPPNLAYAAPLLAAVKSHIAAASVTPLAAAVSKARSSPA